jgi:hypothetical protein
VVTIDYFRNSQISELEMPMVEKEALVMPIYPKSLDDTFGKLVGVYNRSDPDYSTMKPFLHEKITWKMLHHADSVQGRDTLIQWLIDKKLARKPQFDPKSANSKPPDPDGSVQISGEAEWRAGSGGPPEQIIYNFTFFPDGADRWLLKNAFGALK